MAGEVCSGCLQGPLDTTLVMICEHRLCLSCAAQHLQWQGPGSSGEPVAECPRCGVETKVDVAAAHHLRALRAGGASQQRAATSPPPAARTSALRRPSPASTQRAQSSPLSSPMLPTPSLSTGSGATGIAPMTASGNGALMRDALRASKDAVCGQCQESLTVAELYCRECREQFCGPCSASVHKKGRLREHTLIPCRGGGSEGGDVSGGGPRSPLASTGGGGDRIKSPLFGGRDVYCPLHPEDPLQFFCLQCECECICAECAVHGEHRGHDVLNVRHAYKNMAGRIAEAMSSAQARAEDQKKALQLSDSQLQEVEVVIARGKQAIQDAFERMRVTLAQKEAHLLQDAEQVERLASDTLQAKVAAAEGHVRTLQDAQSSLRKLETRGDEVKALNSYAAIRAKVLNVLAPIDGLDNTIERELEEVKSRVQSTLEMQVTDVATLSNRVADIRRADASAH